LQKLKILGERNTGTNYLEKLCDRNFKVKLLNGASPKIIHSITKPPFKEYLIDTYFYITRVKNLGWKHAIAPHFEEFYCSPNNVHFITITKNPYSWLLSLHRNPYHYSGKDIDRLKSDFIYFLRSKWQTVKRERHNGHFETPIDMWNKKNRSYSCMKDSFKYVINLKYEHLLSNPQKVLNMIKNKFQFCMKSEEIVNLSESTKESSKDYSYYKNYYLEELWREFLSEESIEYINQRLDPFLMDYFGYSFK